MPVLSFVAGKDFEVGEVVLTVYLRPKFTPSGKTLFLKTDGLGNLNYDSAGGYDVISKSPEGGDIYHNEPTQLRLVVERDFGEGEAIVPEVVADSRIAAGSTVRVDIDGRGNARIL